MTIALFTALLVILAFVFLTTYRSNSPYLFALACLLAVVSTLCRQLGLSVSIAYLVVNVFRPDERVDGFSILAASRFVRSGVCRLQ
jgi:type III secretory pathway component EscU